MKRYINLFLSLFFIAGCTSLLTDEINESNKVLDEAIKDNASRIEKLEKMCTEMNTNITSMQAILKALQENDYVESVTPIETEGKVTGYTIKFIKSGNVTIYHGTDGKDAHNPVIGVKADNDGLYYWTLDGEWLLDESGAKVRAEGKDGITPRLRIIDRIWEVSYDGKTWTQLGPAVGEDGKSFFSSVEMTNSSLNMVLSDGTAINLPLYRKIEIELALSEETAGIAAGKEIHSATS